MELDDLRLFTATARLGNLTAAARLLHVPKSSASRSIGRLEEALGISLLYRSNRKILLTEAGALFYDHATAILERFAEANSSLDELRQSPRGTLKVSVPVNPGQFLIAPLVGRFLERYPDINLTLVLTGDAIEPLTGDVDVAIRTGALKDSSLMARRLGVAHLGLYASAAYLAVHGRPEEPEDLVGHALIDIAERGDTWALTSASRNAEVPAQCRMLVNDTTVIKAVLLSGFGIGWLPTYMGTPEVRRGLLDRVLVEWSRGAREIHAVFASHRLISPKVRVFIDFLAEHLAIPD
jgi:DNA-binding transcriptional LysR family regulator